MSVTQIPVGGGGGGGFPGYGSVVGVGLANSDGVSPLVSRADHIHAHDNQPGGSLHALVISGGAAGFMSGADKAKLDGIAPLATNTPLSVVAAQTVGTVNTIGAAVEAARGDHVHAHGAQTDPTLHAVVTALANGFMTPAMLAALTALVGSIPQYVDIPVDFGDVEGGGDFLAASAAPAWVTPATIFTKPVVLADPADHDPEDVLLEEMDANIESFGAAAVSVNVIAPNMTWGRYTVRVFGYNP